MDSGYSYIPSSDDPSTGRLPYQGGVRTNLGLLQQSDLALQKLTMTPAIQRAAQPLLWHPDLNMRNIFVSEHDPTQITALIDWQSTGVDAALMHALDTPDFAEPLPYDRDLDGKNKSEDSASERAIMDVGLCSQAFEVCAKATLKFCDARALDPVLMRLFSFL